MLDSPGLSIAARRIRPPVEDDPRPAATVDDLAQRRDLALIDGRGPATSMRSTRSSRATRTTCTRSSCAWSPIATRPPTPSRRPSYNAYRNLAGFRGGSVRSWLGRIAINAAMDAQRFVKRRPAQPYPELEDEAWQPPAPITADPEHTALHAERSRALEARSPPSPPTSGRRSSSSTSRATTTRRSPT